MSNVTKLDYAGQAPTPPLRRSLLLGRGIVGVAVAVYLVVLGCVVLPGAGPRNSSGVTASSLGKQSSGGKSEAGAISSPYRGAAIQIQRVDWIDKYEQSIDEIAQRGFDTVSLVIDSRQENGSSARIYLDMRMTPTPDKLAELIGHAKAKGLRVILMPIVLLDNPIGNQWRGTIAPNSDAGGWDEWFDSYRNMLKHFAWIAQQNHVDVMSVGSELVSTESNQSQWHKTIREVREIFHGKLTYSANWDHYTSIPFWDELDLIGLNSYWSLDEVPPGSHEHMKEKVTVEQIVENWKYIQKDLLDFQQEKGKPIIFLEIGWCSLANAADEPWDYTRVELDQDNELQKKLYEGFFEAWYGKPGLGGFMVWEWTPGDGGKGSSEGELKGYTPENKPAEGVIREWLSKPWK